MITIDGNGAVTSVAFRTSEVIAIYPITPGSTMAETGDAWAGNGLNVWGDVPRVVEMQSGGRHWRSRQRAADRRLSPPLPHRRACCLMIPPLYKLAGQLMPFVLRRRTVATVVDLRRPFRSSWPFARPDCAM